MAKKYHPDTNKDPTAQQSFLKVKEAFELLKNPSRRAEYDRDGDISGEEMVAPIDPQIKWYHKKSYRGNFDEWESPDNNPLAEQQEKERLFRLKIVGQLALCFILYGIWLQFQPVSDGTRATTERYAWGRKTKADGPLEPRDAATVRAFNDARLPKRAYVIREYVLGDDSEELSAASAAASETEAK